MAKVVFWSPEEGATGLTHSVIAISTLMGIKYKQKSLLMGANRGNFKIESSYTPYEDLVQSKILESSSSGIGALTKIIVSNKLTPSVIENYAKPILKEKLDVLYSTMSDKEEQYNITMNNLSLIISKAESAYDIVLVDLMKGDSEKYTKDVLQDADVIVCVGSQDSTKFQKYFNLDEEEYYLKDKKIIYTIGNYDYRSKYNDRNLKRRYRFKDPLYVVPYNVNFADACNDATVVDYFYKHANASIDEIDGDFIANVQQICDEIVNSAGIK